MFYLTENQTARTKRAKHHNHRHTAVAPSHSNPRNLPSAAYQQAEQQVEGPSSSFLPATSGQFTLPPKQFADYYSTGYRSQIPRETQQFLATNNNDSVLTRTNPPIIRSSQPNCRNPKLNCWNFEPQPLRTFQVAIRREIQCINGKLQCNRDPINPLPPTMSSNRKRQIVHHDDSDKENIPIKFFNVPPSSWVYQTPPNRKLNMQHVLKQQQQDNNGLQLGVVEKCSKNIYELNRKINADFYAVAAAANGAQEITIDKRLLIDCKNASPPESKQTEQIADAYELENHFLSLTCRPKKTYTRLAANYCHQAVKRKRHAEFKDDEDDASLLNEAEGNNFTFISSDNNNDDLYKCEQSFHFQFTENASGTSDNLAGSSTTTTTLFDFDGNKRDTFNFEF